MAQWIERWTSNPKVAGSSPAQGILLQPEVAGTRTFQCISCVLTCPTVATDHAEWLPN